MLTSLKLVSTAMLGFLYLWVAFLVLHPDVDAEYTDHYLHRVANCWVPQAARRADSADAPPTLLEIGQLSHAGVCRYLRLGWWNDESWGTWSNGDRAILRLPRERGARDVEITLRTAPAPSPAIPVTFTFNGQTIGQNIAPGTTTTVSFPLPPEGEPYNPDMRLTFGKYALVASVSPLDGKLETRHVGVGVIAIRYLSAPAANHATPPNGAL